MGNRLISVAREIVLGGEVSAVDFEFDFAADFSADDLIAQKIWYFCRQFQDDEDIRSRDEAYDEIQRERIDYWMQKYLQKQEKAR